MRVGCENCGKQIQIPAEKVPDRAFSFSCPTCKQRIAVDPTAPAPSAPTAEPEVSFEPEETPEAAVPETAVPDPAPSPPLEVAVSPMPAADTLDPADTPDPAAVSRDSVSRDSGRMPPLSAKDRQLLATVVPVTLVVNADLPPDPELEPQLQALAMEEIRQLSDVARACDELIEAEAGLLLVRVAKAAAPPFDLLEPIHKLPPKIRRRVYVALVADNVRDFDGQIAFYLQLNCVLKAGATNTLAARLRRGMLFHLRLYQHWEAADPT